ncbi:hypothetical protein SVIO_047510 [Streptomyces violaceusniger]|uniref:FHA domain-containing protein n=1 Tax=Streptomyces violaceusniger TaxID=68280 RepID=A0A4D4L6F5_STRVO|nr:hypothetical protein SVIO_047510 [Streptomyces violaceusniger]
MPKGLGAVVGVGTPARPPGQKGPLTAMQIRLTVLGPRSAHPGRSGHHPAPASVSHALTAAVDVLVTAPVGTALAAVSSGLADAVAAAGYEAGGGGGGGGAVVLYAGGERLDPQRCALGEPPLVDGAVLSLHGPADPDSDHYPGYPGLPESAVADATVHLDVVAGPDAGGVHLLHGGQVRIGRSADADVPLDDPDVSRLHCAVTVAEDGRVTIADLGSTNGTAADGVPVGPQPVPLEPGALLRIGESALRLRVPSRASAIPSAPTRLPVQADGEGHLRVTPAGDHPTHAKAPWTGAPQSTAPTHTTQGPWTPPARHPGTGWTRVAGPGDESHAAHDRAGAHGSDDGWGPAESAAPGRAARAAVQAPGRAAPRAPVPPAERAPPAAGATTTGGGLARVRVRPPGRAAPRPDAAGPRSAPRPPATSRTRTRPPPAPDAVGAPPGPEPPDEARRGSPPEPTRTDPARAAGAVGRTAEHPVTRTTRDPSPTSDSPPRELRRDAVRQPVRRPEQRAPYPGDQPGAGERTHGAGYALDAPGAQARRRG